MDTLPSLAPAGANDEHHADAADDDGKGDA